MEEVQSLKPDIPHHTLASGREETKKKATLREILGHMPQPPKGFTGAGFPANSAVSLTEADWLMIKRPY